MEDSNWTQTKDEKQLFEFEHDDYSEVRLRGEDRKLTKKVGTAGHWKLKLLYRRDCLATIVHHADAREPVHERAAVWIDDHPGLAGFRINDGVENDDQPRTHRRWSKDEREKAVQDLRQWGYGEGDCFFHGGKNDYYIVTELTVDGFVAVPLDDFSRQTSGIYSTYIANICHQVEQDCHPVRDAVRERPDEILRDYADQQINRTISMLGRERPFRGIDGVERVRDLEDALCFSKLNSSE